MNRICWRGVDLVARLLEPDERNAVRGDLSESGASGGEALRDILGLVVRRQAALWKRWQPWLALIGLVGVTALFLSRLAQGLDFAVAQQLRTYWRYGVHYGTGVTIGQEFVSLACLFVALFLWSWTSGFVLASLSGRAVWLTGALFYVIVLDSFPARLLLSGAMIIRHSPSIPVILLADLLPLSISRIMFLLAAVWGVNRGLRLRALPFRQMFLLVLSLAILTSLVIWTGGWYETAHQFWSGGVWRAVPWPRRLMQLAPMTWPALYMFVTSWQQQRRLSPATLTN